MDHTWMRIAVDLAARVSGDSQQVLPRRTRCNNDEVMIEFS